MEACATGHYWARTLTDFGHDVRLIAPKFVKPVNAGVNLGHVAAQNWATLDLRGAGMSGGGQSAALFM